MTDMCRTTFAGQQRDDTTNETDIGQNNVIPALVSLFMDYGLL